MNNKLTGPFKFLSPGKKADKLVIFLHGVGADGYDLMGLSDEFMEVLPNAVFLSPHGPFPYDEYPSGYQWFSLRDRSEDKLYQGIQASLPILKAYIDENLKTHNLKYKDLVLIGFSQGTMMALQLAPRLPESCFAVIGFSGALVSPKALAKEIISNPPIFLSHVSEDQVVPISSHKLSMKALKDMGFTPEEHIMQGAGHTISLESLERAKEFLGSLL
jgi:phospholipase/carboxylesterase